MIKHITLTHKDHDGGTELVAEPDTDDNGRDGLSVDTDGEVFFTAAQWRAFRERVDGLFEPRDYPQTNGRYDNEPY